MPRAAECVVIGAGVIGCAIARELALAGAGRIIVLDRGHPGGEASGAAAGVLAVASTRAPRGVLHNLRCLSAGLYPSLVESLREETGIDVEYRDTGLLEIAFEPVGMNGLSTLVGRRAAQGFDVQLLTAEEARAIEPGINPEIAGAAVFRDDKALNNTLLMLALCRSAERKGVEFQSDSAVTGFRTTGSRVSEVVTREGTIAAGRVILAAGAWSSEVGALLNVKIPIRPDRGEMLALQGDPSLRHTVVLEEGYLIPRKSGEILVGSTSTRNCADRSFTEKSFSILLRRAQLMVPGLTSSTVVRRWTGLRPCPTICRPIIGPLRGFENVFIATGHHRSGILLAPITAQLVREYLMSGQTSVSLKPFAYRPG